MKSPFHLNMTHKRPDTCSTCKFWIKASHHDSLSQFFGSCHKNPPSMFDHPIEESYTSDMIENKEFIGKFPYTHYLNWCGEYSYNKLIENIFPLIGLNFHKNERVISEEVGYDIFPDNIVEKVDELILRQIGTIGDWQSIKDYEPMLIPNLGRATINAINAAILLYQKKSLDID